MGTQRFTSFDYAHLSKFSSGSCTVDSVDIPDIQRTRVAKVQAGQQAPLNYHTSERKEVVDFTVTYIPYDNAAGKALLPLVKELVDAVLEKGYEPKTATIQVKRLDVVQQVTFVDNCVITAGEIMIDVSDYVRIKFYLQGTLNALY
jgi:hypothetical protein